MPAFASASRAALTAISELLTLCSPVSRSTIQWRWVTWMPSSTSAGSGPTSCSMRSLLIGSPGRKEPVLTISATIALLLAGRDEDERDVRPAERRAVDDDRADVLAVLPGEERDHRVQRPARAQWLAELDLRRAHRDVGAEHARDRRALRAVGLLEAGRVRPHGDDRGSV